MPFAVILNAILVPFVCLPYCFGVSLPFRCTKSGSSSPSRGKSGVENLNMQLETYIQNRNTTVTEEKENVPFLRRHWPPTLAPQCTLSAPVKVL